MSAMAWEYEKLIAQLDGRANVLDKKQLSKGCLSCPLYSR